MQVTGCECAKAGWCERHQFFKDRFQVAACRRLQAEFDRWETGYRPRVPSESSAYQSRDASCRHLGEVHRQTECPSCTGHVTLKVFVCRVHNECTLKRPVDGVTCCTTCNDYQPIDSEKCSLQDRST